MVMDDSRSIGQVTFMFLPSDEHSFWVKSSRTLEDTRILSRPLVDTLFRSDITGRLQSTMDYVDEQSNFVDLTDDISVLSDELDIDTNPGNTSQQVHALILLSKDKESDKEESDNVFIKKETFSYDMEKFLLMKLLPKSVVHEVHFHFQVNHHLL